MNWERDSKILLLLFTSSHLTSLPYAILPRLQVALFSFSLHWLSPSFSQFGFRNERVTLQRIFLLFTPDKSPSPPTSSLRLPQIIKWLSRSFLSDLSKSVLPSHSWYFTWTSEYRQITHNENVQSGTKWTFTEHSLTLVRGKEGVNGRSHQSYGDMSSFTRLLYWGEEGKCSFKVIRWFCSHCSQGFSLWARVDFRFNECNFYSPFLIYIIHVCPRKFVYWCLDMSHNFHLDWLQLCEWWKLST